MVGMVLPCGLKEEGSIFLSPQCWEAETHVLWLTGKYIFTTTCSLWWSPLQGIVCRTKFEAWLTSAPDLSSLSTSLRLNPRRGQPSQVPPRSPAGGVCTLTGVASLPNGAPALLLDLPG